MLVSHILFVLYLVYVSYRDIKHRGLYNWELVCGIPFAILAYILNPYVVFLDALFGCVIGIVFLVISVITKGQIGNADGILLAETGLAFGLSGNIVVIGVALFGVFLISVVMMVSGRLHRGSTLPFVPFVLLGGVMTSILFMVE